VRYTSWVSTSHQIYQASEAFAALDIAPTADDKAIQKAFRARVKLVHPDLRDGDEAATKRLYAARALLTKHVEDNTLVELVQGVKAYEDLSMASTPQVVSGRAGLPPMGREAAIPGYARATVLEYAGGGEYTLYLYGQFLRGNLSPGAAERTLRRMIGPQFQGSISDILVWVFVPGVSVKRVSLPSLEEALRAAAPGDHGPRKTSGERAVPIQQPASGYEAAPERPSTNEEPPEGLAETFKQEDWRGMFMGYVLIAERGNIRIFTLKRSRGQLDVSYFGSYGSSAAALLALSRKGLNPDLVPVWILSDVLGAEPTRLGAA
jgi:hypothetical protein